MWWNMTCKFMLSQRLKNIFALSIPLFIAHGIEEIVTSLYSIDSHVAFMFGKLAMLPTMQALFILFQVMLWVVLIVWYLLIRSERWQLWLMALPGVIFIYELHHFYKALAVGGYYPGLLTALLFPIIGYLYWREWIKLLTSH